MPTVTIPIISLFQFSFLFISFLFKEFSHTGHIVSVIQRFFSSGYFTRGSFYCAYFKSVCRSEFRITKISLPCVASRTFQSTVSSDKETGTFIEVHGFLDRISVFSRSDQCL